MSDNRQKGFWHKSAVFLGLAEDVSEKRGETVYGPVSAPSHARFHNSTVVTPGDALSLVSVYRAVSIISTAIKGMPAQVFRQGVEVLPTPTLVKSPSVKDSRGVIIEETVMSLALSGNAYWRLMRSGPTEPVVAIEVLNPHAMHIETKDDVVVGYRYGDKSFKVWEIKHLALLRVPGSVYGLGPIQAAQSTLRGAHDVRDYSANWFRDSGVPAGILKTDQTITGEQAGSMQDRFVDALGASRVPVLGNGVNFQPIYLSPADAQFLETQQFTKTEIATLFGVPALYMLADAGNSQSYSNQQQVDVAFLKYTLSQYLYEIEQAFSDLLPRGQDARFNPEGLLRTDTKARYESFAIGLTNGWLSVNEVRAIEGLPAVPGGDEVKPKAAPAPEAPNTNDGGQPNDQ